MNFWNNVMSYFAYTKDHFLYDLLLCLMSTIEKKGILQCLI